MPAKLDVDREAVKTLVLAIGVREAARKMNLAENTVLAWSKRGKWLEQVRNPPQPPPTMLQPAALNAITASAALAQTLATRKENTRAHLARFAEEAALEAATADNKLKIARQTKDVAAVMSSVWPEKEQAVALNLWGDTQMIVNVGEAG